MAIHIGRRELIAALGSAATWPLAVCAQQPERMRRIGVFMPGVADDPEFQAFNAAFLQRLAELAGSSGAMCASTTDGAPAMPSAVAPSRLRVSNWLPHGLG